MHRETMEAGSIDSSLDTCTNIARSAFRFPITVAPKYEVVGQESEYNTECSCYPDILVQTGWEVKKRNQSSNSMG